MNGWSSAPIPISSHHPVFESSYYVTEPPCSDIPAPPSLHISQQAFDTAYASNSKTVPGDFFPSIGEDCQNRAFPNYYAADNYFGYKNYGYNYNYSQPQKFSPVKLSHVEYDSTWSPSCPKTNEDKQLQVSPLTWNFHSHIIPPQTLANIATSALASTVSAGEITKWKSGPNSVSTLGEGLSSSNLPAEIPNDKLVAALDTALYPSPSALSALPAEPYPKPILSPNSINASGTYSNSSSSSSSYVSPHCSLYGSTNMEDFSRNNFPGLMTAQVPACLSNPASILPILSADFEVATCKICNIPFCSQYYLNKHMEAHAKGCPNCPKCSHVKRVRTKHEDRIKYEKADLILHACGKCGESFSTPNELERHQKTHENEQRPFKCAVWNCKFAATSSKGLYNHKQTKHIFELGVAKLVCNYCGRVFGLKFCLTRHIITHHNTDRPFRCTKIGCKKSFKLKQHLVQHLKVHQKRLVREDQWQATRVKAY